MDGGMVIVARELATAEPVGPLLQLRDVRHTYRGGVQALAGVDL